MVILTEQIEIPASYEKMEAWAANFEEEFVKWSPYHIECNLYNGNYHAGSKIRFREIVMGLDYDRHNYRMRTGRKPLSHSLPKRQEDSFYYL